MHASLPSDPAPPSRWAPWLIVVGLGSLLLRALIAWKLPITGDEAFFWWWGVYPDWGYSDHPPMVGWFNAAMGRLLGDSVFAMRLPAVLLPLLVGGAIGLALRGLDRERAAVAVLLFWLTPIGLLQVLMTTDIPLALWSALSVAVLWQAERRERLDGRALALYALAGLFLALAFLSKYFAVLLGLAYLAHFALFRRERLAGFALLVLVALIGPALHLAWNQAHCWPNVMFNLINRNEGEVFEWRKPGLYLGMMVYLLTPGAAWLAWRERGRLGPALRAHRLLACVVIVPHAVFALLAFKKVIGLHWVLAFYPFLFALLAFLLPRATLRKAVIAVAVFGGLHVLAALGVMASSLEHWQRSSLYPSIVRSVKTDALLAQVESPGVIVMASAFTPASIYGHARRHYMPVFGPGKFHSRQDDQLVDFADFEGNTLRILVGNKPVDLAGYAPYFDQVRAFNVQQDGATFHVIEGQGFRLAAYRLGVLAEIDRRYYQIPRWLPMSDCAFCRRLCGAVRCSGAEPKVAPTALPAADAPRAPLHLAEPLRAARAAPAPAGTTAPAELGE
ncbi:glycosyltransferase family 39 protein [Aquariibacter albus]|uniref:Glycosyltransferase family 39 protein n=1 Tax=Aquariibacter albus TaxID=2759899 RepID=A0A839HTU2_9BURK|nr:glycosyltransferase family 39 protein [Aquariibacter albus]MBB1161404.1 glycosyltransferase family 39 protein [Aquariibacter albus]